MASPFSNRGRGLGPRIHASRTSRRATPAQGRAVGTKRSKGRTFRRVGSASKGRGSASHAHAGQDEPLGDEEKV